MLEEVRSAMEDLESRGMKPSVRAVRTAIGRGSHTDIGEAIRKIQEERSLLNHVRHELPQSLHDKASILGLDIWVAAQELANRAIDDIRRGCEMRVASAESQSRESLREIDDAEARIQELVGELSGKETAIDGLEKAVLAATQSVEEADARVKILEAEIRILQDHASRRDRELELAFRGVDQMVAAMGGSSKPKPVDSAAASISTEMVTALPSPLTADATPVKFEDLVDLVVTVLKTEPGRALSAAEIHARLPNSDLVQQRQIYNLLYRRSAAGATFLSVGEGKFALREESD